MPLPVPALLCLLKPLATRVAGEAQRQLDASQADPPPPPGPCPSPFKSLLTSWSLRQHKLYSTRDLSTHTVNESY